MTVKELKNYLEKFDENIQVVIPLDGSLYCKLDNFSISECQFYYKKYTSKKDEISIVYSAHNFKENDGKEKILLIE